MSDCQMVWYLDAILKSRPKYSNNCWWPVWKKNLFTGRYFRVFGCLLEIWSENPQSTMWNPDYSGDLNSNHLKIRTFWRLDFKWSGFIYGYSYSPNHAKTQTFLSGFQMLGLPFFRFYSKSGPFATQQASLWLYLWSQPFESQTAQNPDIFVRN